MLQFNQEFEDRITDTDVEDILIAINNAYSLSIEIASINLPSRY